MSEIEDKILELRDSLKSDRLNISFGELINLYEDRDLIISSEYQKNFRWNDKQRSNFIESILLKMPVLPIFVAEDEEGKWELIYGLEQIYTIFSFFGVLEGLEKNQRDRYQKLVSTELIGNALDKMTIKTLPLKIKLAIQRTICRVEILRFHNSSMKYNFFKRLNTSFKKS